MRIPQMDEAGRPSHGRILERSSSTRTLPQEESLIEPLPVAITTDPPELQIRIGRCACPISVPCVLAAACTASDDFGRSVTAFEGIETTS